MTPADDFPVAVAAEIIRRAEAKAKREALERELELQLRALGLTDGMVREYKFIEGRRFRFDFAWPELWVAVEVEGINHAGTRHQRIKGYTDDCRKYNAAAMLGWRVLRFPQPMLKGAGDDIATALAVARSERGI